MDDLRNALMKLKNLSALPRGWNYGTGCAPSSRTIRLTAVTLQYLGSLDSENFDVLPTDQDGVTILASHGEMLAEILINASGVIDLFLEIDNNDLEYSNLNFSELTRTLEDAGWQSTKSFGSRTHVFTVQSTEDSPVPLLRIAAAAHRSFAQRVSRKKEVLSANTSADITPALAENPRSSAEFLPQTLATTHG